MYDIDGNGTIDEKEMIKIIEVIHFPLLTFHSNSPISSPSLDDSHSFFKSVSQNGWERGE